MMRRYAIWLWGLLCVGVVLWAPKEADACSKACYCIPGHWVPQTNEVPFNAVGIFWIKNASPCGIEAYTPKLEDFKLTDMSEDPPVEIKLSIKEPTDGVFLLTPETPFEKDKQYKVEFLPELCKDSPQKPPADQALKPLTFKAVEEGSFPAGQVLKLTQRSCGYDASEQCNPPGVDLSYEVSLPNALKIWTDLWQVRLLVDGKVIPSTTVYGKLTTGFHANCEAPKSDDGNPLVGDIVVQMEISLPGWGRSYLSEQYLLTLKCEEQNTCVQKATAKAGDPPPSAGGCGCQSQPHLPAGWLLCLLLLWPCLRRRRAHTFF